MVSVHNVFTNWYGVPKIGVPPVIILILDGIFPEINHLTIGIAPFLETSI